MRTTVFYILVLMGRVLAAATAISPQQGIQREWFLDIPGDTVTSLTNAAAFPDRPSGSSIEPLFEAPRNFANDYGTRMRGYLLPPKTGSYTLWIASDDQSVLLLSTDESPTHASTIASVSSWTNDREWDRYPEQRSASILLLAGRRYYVEVLHKDGAGDDHVSVGWQLPDGTLERPIPGLRLFPWEVLSPDFGDAPLGYPVTLAENGPSHSRGGPKLGSSWDSEKDGTHSDAADYDDTHGATPDDEDGVVFVSTRGTITVDVTAGADGYLDAWMDFTRDGDWDDRDEHILSSQFIAGGSTNRFFISVPGCVTKAGQFVSRWRFSEAGGLGYTGDGGKGEVEDYVTEWAPEETDPCPELAASLPDLSIELDKVGGVLLRWRSVAGASYRIEWTGDLAAGSWTILKSVFGTGGELSLPSAASSSARYFRLVGECHPLRLGSWGQTIFTSERDLTGAWRDDITNYVTALWETGQNFCIYPIDHNPIDDDDPGRPNWADFKLLLDALKGTDFQIFAAIGAPHLGDKSTWWHDPELDPSRDCNACASETDYDDYYNCKVACLQYWRDAWTNAAKTLSQLSLTYTNLVGLVFNDFDMYVESVDYPACLFGDRLTHAQVKEIADAAHFHNCKFGFWPTCYYSFAPILSDGYILGADYGVSLIKDEEMSVTLEFMITTPKKPTKFGFFHSDSLDADDRGLNLFKEVYVNDDPVLSSSLAGQQSHEYFEADITSSLVAGEMNSITLKLRASGDENGCSTKFWYVWHPVLQIDTGIGWVMIPFLSTSFNTVALNLDYPPGTTCASGLTGTDNISNDDRRDLLITTGCSTLTDDDILGHSAKRLVAAPTGPYSIRDLVDGIVAPYYATTAPLYDARRFEQLLDAAVSELRGAKLMALQLGKEYPAQPVVDLVGLSEQLNLAAAKADYTGLWEMPLGLYGLDSRLGMFAERDSNKADYNFMAYWPPQDAVQGWYQRWRSTSALKDKKVKVTIYYNEDPGDDPPRTFNVRVYWDKGLAGSETICEATVAKDTPPTICLDGFEVTDTLVLEAAIGLDWTWSASIYFNVEDKGDTPVDLGPDSGFWTYETDVSPKSHRTYDVEKKVFLDLRK